MNAKIKKIVYGIIDIIGYGEGMSLGFNVAKNVLYPILRNGQVTIKHTFFGIKNEKISLITEIVLSAGFAVFCGYKFIKNMVDREKLIH